MRTYRVGLRLSLIGNIVLLGAVTGVWWHFHRRQEAPRGERQAKSAELPTSASSPAAPPAPSENARVPVELSPQGLQTIGVKTGEVQRKFVEDEIRTTGNVAVDETKLAYVQVRFSGYIQKVFADATYQYVHRGQPLFTIYSPALVATEREYLVAKRTQQQLSQSTVSGVASGAASLVSAAAGRLAQWDVPPQEVKRLELTRQIQQYVEIDSPVSGYIIERHALPNLTVQPETRLYTIADLSTVWVQAQVFQNDLGRVRIGDPATLTVDSYSGRTFRGRVNFIYPHVEASTRTASVRIVFSNPGVMLKPGMFVNVGLEIPMGRHLVIPATGVLQSGTRQIVFVDRGDGHLEPRDIQLGARVGDDFIVLEGLKAGEKIVTSANFLIDSESQLQAALGSFVPPPPGAGAASAINAPQGNIEFTSEPNPPHKGNNLLRVRLVDAQGAPISQAQVTVTFFMPAMPAMGMAAMRTSVPLNERGNGVYEASAELSSGGTWQVTIVARRNGQTVASQQLSVNATGGM